jgi:exodeoxyribonuclease-1
VISSLATLGDRAVQWGIDIDQNLRHADIAALHAPRLAGMWPAVYERPPREGAVDVDEDLYGGFLGNDDRRTLQRLSRMDGTKLAAARPAFADARLSELFFRYRARNFPDTLSEAERAQWLEHCAHRLHDGAGGALTMAAFLEQIDALGEAADERGQEILGALVDYATQIAPEIA